MSLEKSLSSNTFRAPPFRAATFYSIVHVINNLTIKSVFFEMVPDSFLDMLLQPHF